MRSPIRWADALVLAFVLAAGAALAADRGADGRFEVRRSSHFVLHQDVDIDQTSGLRGTVHFEQQVLAELESAYRDLDETLGLRPRRPITVVVYDPAIFDARYRGLFRFPAAGFYGGRVHVRGDVQVSEALVRTLHHELVHAALDAEAPSLALPAWLNEGLAEWFESRSAGQRRLSTGQQQALYRQAHAGGLFALADLAGTHFGQLAPADAQLAYLQSYAFVEYLARIHGERALRELCQALLRTGDLERSVRRSFRSDLARLEARHREELLTSTRR